MVIHLWIISGEYWHKSCHYETGMVCPIISWSANDRLEKRHTRKNVANWSRFLATSNSSHNTLPNFIAINVRQ